MAKKPQGGAHVKERKVLLSAHGLFYLEYLAHRITEQELANDVASLRDVGISFDEIVEARAKAIKEQGGRVGATR